MASMQLEMVHTASPELLAALNGLATALAAGHAPAPVREVRQAAPQPPAPPVPAIPSVAAAPTTAAIPAPPVPAVPVTAVPTTARVYTLDDLGRAGAQLMDAGKGAEATALLGKFGIQTLLDLPQEHYGAFATELRALGASI